jgi:hypothetical protein
MNEQNEPVQSGHEGKAQLPPNFEKVFELRFREAAAQAPPSNGK